MSKVPVDDVAVEIFAKGEGVYSIRSGTEVLQVELNDCTQLPEPPQEAMGEAVGIFRVGTQKEKLDFEAVPAASTAAPAAAPAPASDAPPPADAAPAPAPAATPQ